MHIALDLIISGLMLGMAYGLISMGLTIPLALFGIVNLGHGAVVLSAPLLAMGLMRPLDPCKLLEIFILVGLWFGLWELNFRHLSIETGPNKLQKQLGILVFGIGMLSLVEDMGSKISTGGLILLPLNTNTFHLLGVPVSAPKLVLFPIACFIYALLHVLIRRTDIGRSSVALSQDPVASTILGIDSRRIYFLAYCLYIFLSVFSGLALATIIPMNPYQGLLLTIKGLLIIGFSKKRSFLTIIVVSVILGLFETFTTFMFGNELRNIMVYLAFLILIKLSQGSGAYNETIYD